MRELTEKNILDLLEKCILFNEVKDCENKIDKIYDLVEELPSDVRECFTLKQRDEDNILEKMMDVWNIITDITWIDIACNVDNR